MKSRLKTSFTNSFKTPSAHRSTCVLFSLLLLWLVAPYKAAHAGDWVLEKYVYSANTREESQAWNADRTFERKITKTNPKNVSYGFADYVYESKVTRSLSGGMSVPRTYGTNPPAGGWPFKAGSIHGEYTIQSIYKWVRKSIQNYEDASYIDDPTDNPPAALFLWEEATITSGRSHTNEGDGGPETLYSEAHPFTGDWMPLEEQDQDDNFMSPWQYVPREQYSLGTTNTTIKKVSQSRRLIRVDTAGKETVQGPSFTMRATNNFNAKNFQTFVESASLSLGFTYQTRIVKFELTARRQDKEIDSWSDGFTSHEYLIAGGKNNTQHKADLKLRVTVTGPLAVVVPLPGISIAQFEKLKLQLKLSNEKGAKALGLSDDVGGDAEVNAALVLPVDKSAVTDSDGSVPLGIVKSKDLVVSTTYYTDPKSVPPVTVNIVSSDKTGTPVFESIGATIFHDWGQVEWKMGVNGDKAWATDFPNANGEETETAYKTWIWATLKDGGKPIKGHEMKFVASRVEVTLAEENTGEAITKIFTTNMNETGDNVIRATNIDALVEPYITLPTAQSVEDGVYKGQLIVKKNPNFVVESFRLAFQDQGVYKRTGSGPSGSF